MRSSFFFRHFFICLIILISQPSAVLAAEDLLSMDLESLMALEMTTASRKLQPLSRTPTAAHVITREEIRRSGSRSVPEALRLAPGVDVAQISPSQWSVSIRGFGGRYANKLLVLIDGRSIYTPTFNGVYWEQIDLPMDEIERIEVVRGPGATLWGENAVNGVINIITRHTSDVGGRVGVRTGNLDNSIDLRWGDKATENLGYRVWLKHDEAESFDAFSGSPVLDFSQFDSDYSRTSAGFRMDLEGRSGDQFTLQSGVLDLDQGQGTVFPVGTNTAGFEDIADRADVASWNLRANWTRSLSVSSEIALQLSLDKYDRKSFAFSDQRRISDLDFQHSLEAGKSHALIWGLGWSESSDRLGSQSGGLLETVPGSRRLKTKSLFLQDDITLVADKAWLMLGVKAEENDYTGVEWQPQLRGLWQPSLDWTLWASGASAARVPSRTERDSILTIGSLRPNTELNPAPLVSVTNTVGQTGFDRERMTAWEIGVRNQITKKLSFDLALYYHDYDELREGEQQLPKLENSQIVVDFLVRNTASGSVSGAEFYLDWTPKDDWRVQLALNHLSFNLKPQEQPNLFQNLNLPALHSGFSPSYQASLRIGWAPQPDLDLDVWIRAVDSLPIDLIQFEQADSSVPAYQTLDARVAWRPSPSLEISLTGKNLLEEEHLEFLAEFWSSPRLVSRSLLATATYQF